MPIADSELSKPTNAHIRQPATDTVYAALHTWRNTPGSYEWWWLIIEHGERRYTAIRFEGLRDLLNQSESVVHMNTPLSELPAARPNPADWEHPFPGVVTPTVVEQEAMGTARALEALQDSPGRVLVVLHHGEFRGILSAGERTFAFTDKPLLDMLDEFEVHSDDDTLILKEKPAVPPPVAPDAPEG